MTQAAPKIIEAVALRFVLTHQHTGVTREIALACDSHLACILIVDFGYSESDAYHAARCAFNQRRAAESIVFMDETILIKRL